MNQDLFNTGEVQQVNQEQAADAAKLQAERVNAHWRSDCKRTLLDMSETELFGGKKQGGLFHD